MAKPLWKGRDYDTRTCMGAPIGGRETARCPRQVGCGECVRGHPHAAFLALFAKLAETGTTSKSIADARAVHVGAGGFSSALQKHRSGTKPCGAVRHIPSTHTLLPMYAKDVIEVESSIQVPHHVLIMSSFVKRDLVTKSGYYDETVTLDGTSLHSTG